MSLRRPQDDARTYVSASHFQSRTIDDVLCVAPLNNASLLNDHAEAVGGETFDRMFGDKTFIQMNDIPVDMWKMELTLTHADFWFRGPTSQEPPDSFENHMRLSWYWENGKPTARFEISMNHGPPAQINLKMQKHAEILDARYEGARAAKVFVQLLQVAMKYNPIQDTMALDTDMMHKTQVVVNRDNQRLIGNGKLSRNLYENAWRELDRIA